MRRALALWLLYGLACATSPQRAEPPAASEAGLARGVVFHDANHNGRLDPDEAGVPRVAVSNGREVAVSDASGRYTLPVSDDTILFVIKPTGWMTPLSEDQVPRFYYLHKPNGSPENLRFAGVAPTGPLPASVDFPLQRQAEAERFRIVVFGDPQPYTPRQVDYLAADVVPELAGVDAAFGISLGDIVGDDLSLYGPLTRTVSSIGIPWYNVHGNHDVNFHARSDRHSDETWERVFGPGTDRTVR